MFIRPSKLLLLLTALAGMVSAMPAEPMVRETMVHGKPSSVVEDTSTTPSNSTNPPTLGSLISPVTNAIPEIIDFLGLVVEQTNSSTTTPVFQQLLELLPQLEQLIPSIPV